VVSLNPINSYVLKGRNHSFKKEKWPHTKKEE
jgi:hypothetical protein